MFYLKTKREDVRKQFRNASVKCHRLEIKPKVQILTPGCSYAVIGNENKYTLFFLRDENNRPFIDCNCKAGENGQVCYHAAAAYAVHIGIVSIRKTGEKN